MKIKSIAKGMLSPLVATVSLLAGMCLVAAPAGAANPYSTISGTITDLSGSPIAGLCVTVAPADGGSFFDTTVTASDGTYFLPLTEGAYVVFAGCNGGGDSSNSTIYAEQSSSPMAIAAVNLMLNMTMSLGGTLSGEITNSSGTPLSNVCVSANPSSPNTSEPGLGAGTTSNGEYTISGLSATDYAVTVDPTCGGAMTSAYSSQSSQAEVTAESSTTDNFTLTSTSTDTVTFNSDGGSSIAAASGSEGSSITLPSAPTYLGFTFDGWFTAATGGLQVTSPYTLSSSLTLYAQWTADIVTTSPPPPAVTDTVTFNLENGDAPEFMGAINGSNITLPSAPTFVGYTFDGWFTAPTGGSALTSPYVLDGSITLYAQWTAVATPATPPTSPVGAHTLRVVGVVSGDKTSTVRVVGTTFHASPKKIVSNARDTTVRLVRDPKSYLLVRITAGPKSPAGVHTLTVVLHSGEKALARYTQNAARQTSTAPPRTTPPVPPEIFLGTQSANWSGYVLPVNDNSVTSVSGDWIVPTLDCANTPNSAVASWVGLNGAQSTDLALIQSGTTSYCVDDTQLNSGWWEAVPGTPNNSEVFSDFVVSDGDQMAAKVFLDPSGTLETVVQDLTSGLQGTMVSGTWYVTTIANNTMVGGIQGTAPVPEYNGVTSAEWIVEDPEEISATPGNPLFPFANFGTTSFSNLEVNSITPVIAPQNAWEIVGPSGQALTTEGPLVNDGFSESYFGPAQSSSAAEKGSAS